MMYVSSDGTEKDVKTMNTDYVINALAKAYRELFTSSDMKTFEKYSNNIMVLTADMNRRINLFVNNLEVE